MGFLKPIVLNIRPKIGPITAGACKMCAKYMLFINLFAFRVKNFKECQKVCKIKKNVHFQKKKIFSSHKKWVMLFLNSKHLRCKQRWRNFPGVHHCLNTPPCICPWPCFVNILALIIYKKESFGIVSLRSVSEWGSRYTIYSQIISSILLCTVGPIKLWNM